MRDRLLKSQTGFSLVEMLAALAVLSLVSIVVATGAPAAIRAYAAAVDASNSQALLATAMTSLRDELDSAIAAEGAASGDDGQLTFTRTGDTGSTTIANENGGKAGIWLKQDWRGATVPWEALVIAQEQSDHLTATYDSISYSKGLFEISGLKVVKYGSTQVGDSVATFYVRSNVSGGER